MALTAHKFSTSTTMASSTTTNIISCEQYEMFASSGSESEDEDSVID